MTTEIEDVPNIPEKWVKNKFNIIKANQQATKSQENTNTNEEEKRKKLELMQLSTINGQFKNLENIYINDNSTQVTKNFDIKTEEVSNVLSLKYGKDLTDYISIELLKTEIQKLFIQGYSINQAIDRFSKMIENSIEMKKILSGENTKASFTLELNDIPTKNQTIDTKKTAVERGREYLKIARNE